MSALDPVHGGMHHRELACLGIDPNSVLDLSVNINRYGPANSVLRAAREADFRAYGDPTAAGTREVLADHVGVTPEQLALGNGAAELMWSLARVLSHNEEPAVIVEPTFSEYGAAISSAGGRVLRFVATQEQRFAPELEALERVVRAESARSVYLCTPNNPTGVSIPFSSIVSLAKTSPKTIFVVDQAFLSLSSHAAELQEEGTQNMVLLRSLTKDHAIPGLRVAYLIANPALVSSLESMRAPWTVSAPAQAALLASLSEESFIAHSRRCIQQDRNYLVRSLHDIGLEPLPSCAPYLIVKVGDARELRARMLRSHRILIRDCTSFGLPSYVRLASCSSADVDRLVAALAEELS